MERFSLPPGFRFHPTDEELVSHYLKRKVCGRKIQFEAIAEIDLYKYEPWDLPEKSVLQTRDLEWYFFIPRDRKYPNGSRTNRATEKGYWKSTGKDRYIISSSRNVGTKKTLVYYNGRAPKGERTNWVMHEYRLNDVECQRVHAPENGFVLCRVYQKSGPGPRNGEQYGAPVEDEEFEGSPAFEEGDGSGCGLFVAGLMSASAQFTGSPASGCEHEAVSHNINMVDQQFSNPGNQPRNLEFADWPGNMHQSNHSVAGHNVFGGYDELEGPVVLAPPTCHEEDEILRELYELVAQDARKDQSESTDGYQDSTSCLDNGYHQTGAPPLSDGDFLELDDLLSVSDGEEGTEVLRLSKKQISTKLRALSGESQSSSVLQSDAVTTIEVGDCNGQWSFGDGTYERQQNMPEAMQMNSSKFSTITFDPQYQPFKDNLLEGLLPGLHNEELGAARQIGSLEPEFEDVLQFFDHLNAYASENKSFNVEDLAEDIQRKLLQCEDNSLITSQDGHYYDAPVSFTDIGTYGKTRSAGMHSANNHETLQTLISQDPLAGTVDGVLDMLAVNRIDNTEPSERANDSVTESVLLSQGEDVTLRQLGHPPSPLSLLWSCLDSLPTLPASAADLSPKAVSPGRSIRVTATGVGVGAVSVTCTCLGNEMPSSCVNCSMSQQVEKKGKMVKSMSFIWKRKKPLDRWRIGFFMSAVFGVVWAIFWLLIAGGAWKVFGGVYRFMIASET